MARRRLALLLPLALLAGACASDDVVPISLPTVSTTTTTERSTTSTTAQETTSTTAGAGPSTTAAAAPTSTTAPSGPTTPLEGDGRTATFTYELSPERSEFCFRIEASEPIRAADVMRRTGEVAIELPVPGGERTVTGCAASDSVTLQEIDAQPDEFRAEVRTAGGTVRAPLR